MTAATVGPTVEPRVRQKGRAIPIWDLLLSYATATAYRNGTSNSRPTATATTKATEAPQALPNAYVNPSSDVTVTGLRRAAAR